MKRVLILVLIWHLIEVFYPLIDGTSFLPALIAHLVVGSILLLSTYFLFKRKMAAYWFILTFLLLQSFTVDLDFLSFSYFYAFEIDIRVMDSPIGFNPITIILALLLIKFYTQYKIKDTINNIA